MTAKSVSRYLSRFRCWIGYLKPFWALSRTPHALLDMTTPILAAILALGGFPSFGVMILGLITAFSGYTAVYALNDVVDYRNDLEKVRLGGYDDSETYLDGVMIRHPLAKGALKPYQGIAWVIGWSIIALVGAYLLNPVCVWIFLGGVSLEIIYCRMWQTTPYRTIVNGAVKNCGPIAAIVAVTWPTSYLFVLLFFLWIFFWEIGGQNIPADWTDIEEDRRFHAQTIVVKFGPDRASVISFMALAVALPFGILVFLASPMPAHLLTLIMGTIFHLYLLLLPARALQRTKNRNEAITLFNRASYYPAAILVLVLLQMVMV